MQNGEDSKKNVAMDAKAGSSVRLASHHATRAEVVLGRGTRGHYNVTLPLLSGNMWDTLGKLLKASTEVGQHQQAAQMVEPHQH